MSLIYPEHPTRSWLNSNLACMRLRTYGVCRTRWSGMDASRVGKMLWQSNDSCRNSRRRILPPRLAKLNCPADSLGTCGHNLRQGDSAEQPDDSQNRDLKALVMTDYCTREFAKQYYPQGVPKIHIETLICSPCSILCIISISYCNIKYWNGVPSEECMRTHPNSMSRFPAWGTFWGMLPYCLETL